MGSLPLHPAISHLSQRELDDLMDAYLSGTKAIDLIQQFKINILPNQLRKVLPLKELDQNCSICGAVMVQDVPTRQGRRLIEGKISCSACGHVESERCNCRHCLAKRQRLLLENRAQQQARIAKALSKEQLKRHIDFGLPDLSLIEAVAFLALTRCCPVVDGQNVCETLAESSVPFAPTVTLIRELMDILRNAGLVAISEESDAGTIDFDGDRMIYDVEQVRWIVPESGRHELIQKIEVAGLSGAWPEHWCGEVEPLWRKIALAECRQFYDYCAQKRGLHTHSENAVNEMLTNVLRDLSVAQVYGVIWNGARLTSDFQIVKKPHKVHAANYMIGACQRWADRARAEGWAVKAFRRNFDLPRSMISYVLFDVIYKIGEEGFTKAVCVCRADSDGGRAGPP